MNKNAVIIKLLQNRTLNTMQTILAQLSASYVVAGAVLAFIEVITVKEYSTLLIISAVVLIAQLVIEHYREALLD